MDYDLMAFRRIVESRAHGAVPPFHRGRALRIRFRLVDGVRVIHDNVVSALSGSGRTSAPPPDSRCDHFQIVASGFDPFGVETSGRSAADTNPTRSNGGIAGCR